MPMPADDAVARLVAVAREAIHACQSCRYDWNPGGPRCTQCKALDAACTAVEQAQEVEPRYVELELKAAYADRDRWRRVARELATIRVDDWSRETRDALRELEQEGQEDGPRK